MPRQKLSTPRRRYIANTHTSKNLYNIIMYYIILISHELRDTSTCLPYGPQRFKMHDNAYDNFNVCHLSSFPLLWLPLSQIAAAVRVKCPCRAYCGQNFRTLNFQAVAQYHVQILYTIHCTLHGIMYIIINNYNNEPTRICTDP